MDVFGMEFTHESPFTSRDLQEDGTLTTSFAWGTSGAAADFVRTVRQSSFNGRDRKLKIRFHGYDFPKDRQRWCEKCAVFQRTQSMESKFLTAIRE